MAENPVNDEKPKTIVQKGEAIIKQKAEEIVKEGK